MRVPEITVFAVTVMLLAGALPGSDNPYTLRWAYAAAPLITIGRATDVRASRNEPHAPGRVQVCRSVLHDMDVIKGVPPSSGTITVEFRTTGSCAAMSGKTFHGLWFLEPGGSSALALYPRDEGFIPLLRRPTLVRRRQLYRGDERALLASILVEPGVAIVTSDYLQTSLFRDVLGFGGWQVYMRAMSDAYSSSRETRADVALVLSRDAVCLGEARRHMQARGVSPNDPKYRYFDKARLAAFEEHETARAMAGSMKELRRKFGYMEDAEIRDFLVWQACTATTRLRRAARITLQKYFGMAPDSLPCPACS